MKMYLAYADRSARSQLDLRKNKKWESNTFSLYKVENGSVIELKEILYPGAGDYMRFLTSHIKGEDLERNEKGYRGFFSPSVVTDKQWGKFYRLCKKHFAIVDITGMDFSRISLIMEQMREKMKQAREDLRRLLDTFPSVEFIKNKGGIRRINFENKLFLPVSGKVYLSDHNTHIIAKSGDLFNKHFRKLDEPITFYSLYEIMSGDRYDRMSEGKILKLGKKNVPKVMNSFLEIVEMKKSTSAIAKNYLLDLLE